MTRAVAPKVSLVDIGNVPVGFSSVPWARMVMTDKAMLKAKKGSFSITALFNELNDVVLPSGYQSSIRRTSGRVTAMGLLSRARMKKQRAESRGPGA